MTAQQVDKQESRWSGKKPLIAHLAIATVAGIALIILVIVKMTEVLSTYYATRLGHGWIIGLGISACAIIAVVIGSTIWLNLSDELDTNPRR